MDGVLIIDKPAGMTSHDVVNRVRRILNTKRVGHTGTLDPFATGVLVLLVGKATRLAQFVDKAEKEYIAEITFGFATTTGDLTGEPVGDEQEVTFSAADIERVLQTFHGQVEQVPPMYSAKKIEGRKLYELARKGEVVERKPIRATIHDLELLGMNIDGGEKKITVRVACSAGTYIRVLAEDIGGSLGIGAHLTALRRTAAGNFREKESFDLNELAKMRAPESMLLRAEALVSHLRRFEIPFNRVDATSNGLSTRTRESEFPENEEIAMFTPDNDLIAIGIYDDTESCIKPKIVLR